MKSFREILTATDQSSTAIGHFNISDLAALKAVVSAARERGVPVAIGLSESERKFMGTRQAATLVRSIREEHSQPIYLNADHTHSLSSAEEAARAGFDSIVFDRSELPFEQNIAETKQAVESLKTINPDIIVEGEIGYIGSGSEIRDQAPADLTLTTPEECLGAVQIATLRVVHGLVHGGAPELLDPELRVGALRGSHCGERLRHPVGGLLGGSGQAELDQRRAPVMGDLPSVSGRVGRAHAGHDRQPM